MTADRRWCLYPWDVVGDDAAAERIASTGVTGVALAAAYHSVRAATPRHPAHRVVDAAHAAVYFPVRPEAWAGRRLVPEEGAEWAGPAAYEAAAERLRAAGLEVEPWVVLTHSSKLGEHHPELCVTSAFGDRYPYALCPSSEDVVEYAATVVAESVAAASASRIMIEACGPLGVSHAGHHEKTSGAEWSAVDEALLSLCFCAACRRALQAEGASVERLQVAVRTAVGRGHGTVEEALGEHASVVLTARAGVRRQLSVAVGTAAGRAHRALHVQPDPWATGPFAAADGVVDIADTAVLPGPIAEAASAVQISQLRAASRGSRIGAYVPVLPPVAGGEITDALTALSWCDDLYLYHYGLASDARIAAASA